MTLSATFQAGGSLGGGTIKDAGMASAGSVSNNGEGATLTVGYESGKSGGVIHRSIIHMALDEIPVASIVTEATLTLVVTTTGGGATLNLIAFRGTETDWTESTSHPTWTAKDGSNNWAAAGGGAVGTEYTLGTIPSSTGTVSYDVTKLARDAMDNRDRVFSIVLKGSAETGTDYDHFICKSGNNSTADDRPKLEVKYVAGGGASAKTRSSSRPGLASGRGRKRKRLFRR